MFVCLAAETITELLKEQQEIQAREQADKPPAARCDTATRPNNLKLDSEIYSLRILLQNVVSGIWTFRSASAQTWETDEKRFCQLYSISSAPLAIYIMQRGENGSYWAVLGYRIVAYSDSEGEDEPFRLTRQRRKKKEDEGQTEAEEEDEQADKPSTTTAHTSAPPSKQGPRAFRTVRLNLVPTLKQRYELFILNATILPLLKPVTLMQSSRPLPFSWVK